MNGGYHILDLSGITLTTSNQTVTGIWDELKNALEHGKAILFDGVHTASITIAPCFPFFRNTSTTYYFNFILKEFDANDDESNLFFTIRVSNVDAVRYFVTDVTNPPPEPPPGTP